MLKYIKSLLIIIILLYNKSMCEILAPAGSKENLITAINAGADAVYLGLKDFSARKSAQNFDFNELKFSVAYAKTFGVKVYVTVNTLVKDNEFLPLVNAINQAYSLGVDAFILQDVFLGKKLKELMPNIVLHLSTQAGVSNVYGAKLASSYGFSRVILARETTFEDIKLISKIIETEVFIHGALCSSFSGHCYFSSFVGGNSGNRGYCKQPCRKKYDYVVNGKTVKSGYVLSLADLCVNDKIELLKEAGVKSFKIEGRMRSQEYVASTVKYYKKLLNTGKKDQDLFNLTVKSYNRGDFTSGLAFSQDKNFISDKIQNHKGLKVGVINKIVKDKLYLDCKEKFNNGDSFKIIRNGYEVGNATTINGQILFKGNVKVGDLVYITKSVNLLNELNVEPLKKEIDVEVLAKVGEKLKLSALGVSVESESALELAKTSKSTVDEILANLNKVDIYPFKIKASIVTDNNAFIPKAILNNLRANLYSKLFFEKSFKIPYNIEYFEDFTTLNKIENERLNAIITDTLNRDFTSYTDVVYAPDDYSKIEIANKTDKRIWLYLPPFLSNKDVEIVLKSVNNFYGIYADGYYGLQIAKELGLKLFAGSGFNVSNKFDVLELVKNGVTNIVASKELSFEEISKLNYKNLFILTGAIQIMDLIYCPFNKNCKNCEINSDFVLKDEANREFTVKRYKISDCRFKVYNCAKIANVNNFNTINDDLVNITAQTKGNYIKGIR